VHDAEDLTGRVFFKALEAIGCYRDMGFSFFCFGFFGLPIIKFANLSSRPLPQTEFSMMRIAAANLSEHRKSPKAQPSCSSSVKICLRF
jgi:hypothetical protein